MLLKRCFDLFFAIPGLIILSPLLFIVAVLIKADSPGPVFFRQIRVGQAGKDFSIYKFRTMAADGGVSGRQITVGDDPRITKLGRMLRKYKLDELPQLINVVKGEMSLVGPRPEVPRYVAVYPPGTKEKVLSVPPGITDLAAVVFKEESSILGMASDPEKTYTEKILPVKLSYYVNYVDERSLWYDLRLIITTILAVFAGASKGRRGPGDYAVIQGGISCEENRSIRGSQASTLKPSSRKKTWAES